MKLKYGNRTYETSFGTFFRAHLLNSWFIWRRILRAGKRQRKRLLRWVPVLVLFGLLSAGAFSLIAWSGLIDLSGALTGVVSVLVGSAGILIVKDVFDFERARKARLVFQFRFSSRFESKSIDVSRDLFIAAGWNPPVGGGIYRNWANLDAFINSMVPNESVAIKCSEELDLALRSAEGLLAWFQSEVAGREFVDCNPGELSYYTLDYAEKSIRRMALSAHKGDSRAFARAAADYMQSCYNLLNPFRRPWRYRNDIARRKLVDEYVNSHAIAL